MHPVRFLLRVILVFAVPILAAIGTYTYLRDNVLVPAEPGSDKKVLVEIKANQTFKDICRDLEARGIVKEWWSLNLVLKVTPKIRDGGRITAGEYELSPAQTPREILERLTSGQVVTRKVFIPPGSTIWDIASILDRAGVIDRVTFESAVQDKKLTEKAGILGTTFEGYLGTGDFTFSRPISASSVIWKLLESAEEHWPKEFTDKSDELRLNRHEVLTIASMLEKDTRYQDERPSFATVYHARLNEGIKLQSESALRYALGNVDPTPLTQEQLQYESPYNTFTHFGLPPGPICNPSLESMRATLFPSDEKYRFVLDEGTGRHLFFTTIEEYSKEANTLKELAAVPQ